MPEKTIPVGVVTERGGAHLNAYFPALRDTAECDNVVLCDPSGDSFATAKKILGEKLAATYRDLDKMLQTARPRMAMVSMEAVNGPPVIDKLLEADCHVFAEKPACVSAEDFAPLVKKAEEKKLHLLFAFANRMTPAVLKAKSLIDDGLIGDLYAAEMHLVADQTRLTRKSYQESWFADRSRSGGGHLIWLGIHWLDLAMHLTGHSITRVAGFSGIVGGQPLKIEDSAAMSLQFSNGAFGTMTSGYYLDRGYHSHLRLWGSRGWLEYTEHLGGRTKIPLRWNSNKTPNEGIQNYSGAMDPKGYTPWVQECVRTCAGLTEPPISTWSGFLIRCEAHRSLTMRPARRYGLQIRSTFRFASRPNCLLKPVPFGLTTELGDWA